MKIVVHKLLIGCCFLLVPVFSAASQSAPTNFQAAVKSPTEVFLSWDQVAGTTGYHVWRALGSATFVRLTNLKIAATSYTDRSATAGTTYRYRAATVDANSQSSYTTVLTVTTPAEPSVASRETVRPRPRPPGAPGPGLTDATPTPAQVNPSSFSVRLYDGVWDGPVSGLVLFTYMVMPGVYWHLLGGPGMGTYGQQVYSGAMGPGRLFSTAIKEVTASALGVGQYEWTVAPLGSDKKPLTPWTSWPKAQLTITPADLPAGP